MVDVACLASRSCSEHCHGYCSWLQLCKPTAAPGTATRGPLPAWRPACRRWRPILVGLLGRVLSWMQEDAAGFVAS